MSHETDRPNVPELNSLFHQCRQCGSCCRRFRRVVLKPEEVPFIKKMGGHVGMEISLSATRDTPLDDLIKTAAAKGKVHMVHPDHTGCIFLEKRNEKFHCRIYHHRPEACRGFRCNLADGSLQNVFANNAMFLLGKSKFGLPLK